MTLKYKIAELKSFFWKKVCILAMKRSFFWFDYSYLYELMYEWLSYSSSHMKEYGMLIRSKDAAKQMAIAAELCRRLSSSEINENAHITAYGETIQESYKDFNFKKTIPFTEKERNKIKRLHKIEERDFKYCLEYLGILLKKHSRGWWD